MSDPATRTSSDRANRTLTRQLWLFAAGAFAFGFALVPLYDVLCDVTGYGDKSKLREASSIVEAPDANRLITREFVTDAPAFSDWAFRPRAATLEVQPRHLYEAKSQPADLASPPA